MTAFEHYDGHLAAFYSWMAGDFHSQVESFTETFKALGIEIKPGIALDLGAGHGIQSLALARLGYQVKAIDFSAALLEELVQNCKSHAVEPVQADITLVLPQLERAQVQLVLCWGDTLTHLNSEEEVNGLLQEMERLLEPGGYILLGFRDYRNVLEGEQRFIPVKQDECRILTCVLEYFDQKVRVTDLLHEKGEYGWKQSLSSYYKLRLDPENTGHLLSSMGMQLISSGQQERIWVILARKASGVCNLSEIDADKE